MDLGVGRPADTPSLEGTRVVVIDPPPYVRTWNAGRAYQAHGTRTRHPHKTELPQNRPSPPERRVMAIHHQLGKLRWPR